ncbi:MAG: hypothetical protein JNJ99_10075 [Crocinitomicaceae bacterium]|nr:hypothetical protein [Crocinitomicaceae bacterium]
MRRYVYIFFILNLFSNIGKGQTVYQVKSYEFAKIDNSLILRCKNIIPVNDFFLGSFKSKSTIFLYKFSLDKNPELISLKLPKVAKNYLKDYRVSEQLSYENDTLVIRLNHLHLFYSCKSWKSPVFLGSSIFSDLTYPDFENSNGCIYSLGLNYKDPVCPLGASQLELSSHKMKTWCFPFDFPILGALEPTNYLDITNQGFITSQSTSYKIAFYDSLGKLNDSISLSDESVFPTLADSLLNRLEYLSKNPLNVASNLGFLQSLRTKGAQIWQVHEIRKDLVFVKFSKPDSIRGFDVIDHVWRKQNDKWELILSKSMSQYFAKENNLFNESEIWPIQFFGSRIFVSNGLIYYFYWGNREETIESASSFKNHFDSDVPEESLILRLSVIDLSE